MSAPDPLTRRAGRIAAAVLGADAMAHLYWLTGATWPFPDERALSIAVLGWPVPFSPPVLIPLAVLLSLAAVAMWLAAVRSRRLWRWTAVAVCVAAAVQLPPRIGWALGAADVEPVFRWLNLGLYLPLCTLLALAAYRVARRDATRGWTRWGYLVPVVVSSVLAFAAYLPMTGPDRIPSPSAESRFADTALARFHYLREGSGPPLVLLPGGNAATFEWEPQARVLSADHTVYVVDLPGQGHTVLNDPGFAYDLPAMDAAISSFLDAVNLSRVDLAGHSWSGGWALSFAQRHPERVGRLVLLASSGLAVRDVPTYELLKPPLLGELLVRYGYTEDAVRVSVAGLFGHPERATPALVEAMWQPLTVPANLRATWLLERRLDWRQTEAAMPATRLPVLVVWGTRDTILPVWQADRFARLIPDAQAHVLDGCGHALTLDCPDEVNGLMRAFLS
jgi:pimeloyl-ACP methyl ester carboxylesterase